MTTLPAVIVTRRGWVVLAWLALAAVLLPAACRAERSLEVAARIQGSESAAVERLLATDFASPFAYYAILVLTGLPAPDGSEGEAVLAEVLAAVGEVPGVAGNFSYLDLADTLFVGSGGAGSFAVLGLDPGTEPVDVLIPRLREAIGALLPALRERYPATSLRLTGEAALNFDLRRTSTEQANGAERRVLPLTLALLLFAFGALIAAFLPVVTGFLAIPIALGASVLLAEHWPLSILLVNVVSMIGLGLGIDYGLLTVSRFREALEAGASARQAAEEATRHAGHTVVLSGAAVAIGFAALLLVPLNEIRSVAVGGLLVVTASVLLATTLLPGLLAWLGPRVNLGRIRRRAAHRDAGDGWRRWGYWVASHPGRVLAVAGVPLLALSAQGLRLNTELPRGDWLPPGMESAVGLRELEAMQRGAAVQTLRVVLQLPDGMRAMDRRGWAATRWVAESLSADPRAARVQSLPTVVRVPTPSAEIIARLPADVLRSFVSTDQRAVLLEILPHETAEPNELARWVRELRERDAAALAGVPGARIRVGGLPALNADYQDTVSGRFPTVLALVLGGTLLALLVGFRSVLIPVKAVLLNLVSVAAAFGALVLVFHRDYRTHDGPAGEPGPHARAH